MYVAMGFFTRWKRGDETREGPWSVPPCYGFRWMHYHPTRKGRSYCKFVSLYRVTGGREDREFAISPPVGSAVGTAINIHSAGPGNAISRGVAIKKSRTRKNGR